MNASLKNILFIHNTYLQKGGEDTVVANELDCLKKHGFNIFYKEFSNLIFKNKKINSLIFPFSAFFNIFSFFEVLFFLRKHKIKILHAHNIFYKASPSVFWAAKIYGAKTILTIHNYRFFCLNATFFRNNKLCFDCNTNGNFNSGIKNKCFKNNFFASFGLAFALYFNNWINTWIKKVDCYIVVNEFSKELLIQKGISENKIYFKPNFLMKYDAFLNTPKKNFYLFVGRLSEEKGILHLLETFNGLEKNLHIVGNGFLKPIVQSATNERIQYLGLQPKKSVLSMMKDCKALIFPSIWIEGMPMTIIEAQTMGAIPIVAKLVNTEKMIEDGVDGFLYEAGNTKSLRDTIQRFEMLSDSEKHILAQNAYNKAIKYYTEDAHMKLITEIYNK
jgi:glycosyltransferase involved in cell wall biosynthesis